MIEHIQINDVAPRIHYDADGVQSAFTYPFAIFKASDLEVWLGEVRQSAGFSVSGVGISSGGTVLFAVPPVAGTRVTLHRRLALERVSDYQADGIIRAKTLNDELDYQVAALQQVAEDVGRALKLAATSNSPVDLTLPEPAAGRGLKWNPSGSALVNSDNDPDTLGDALQAATDAQAAAMVAGTARDQAIAAAGGIKVSLNDAAMAPLATKLVAGAGITLTEQGDGGDERLSIAATGVPQDITDRLSFLERNLAITVLRDQIDTGWSVLKMVDGVADEFEDEAGLDAVNSSGQTYDATGDFYGNPGGYVQITPAGSTFGNMTSNGGLAAMFNGSTGDDGNSGTAFGADGWGGKSFGSTQNVSRVIVVPSTQTGFCNDGGAAQITLSIYTRIGAVPSSMTDGTLRATLGPFGDSTSQQTFNFTEVAADHCWVVIHNNSGNGNYCSELKYFVSALPANMALKSVAYAADTQPTEARLVVLHQPVAAVTLNTDIIAEISRDGGTTWTAATLSDEGAFDATTRILAATADVSAQPAGTSMVWRLRTLNNKEQRLHGVWMQWR